MEPKHDLTTAVGVFGYFAEHTDILKPVQNEFERLQAENAELKAKNAALEQDQIQTLEAVAQLYEMMIGGAV